MVFVFFADGFEEIEALTPVDFLRRCDNVTVKTVSLNDTVTVTGAHSIPITCDMLLNDVTLDDIEMIVLPGGLKGTLALQCSKQLNDIIDYCYNKKLYIGAICAAPIILGSKGLLKQKNATCYKGFEDKLIGANYISDTPVVVDDNIITAKSAAYSNDFAFALVEQLLGTQTLNKLKGTLIWS